MRPSLPQYRAIIRRADIADAVEISVRVTDPIGRSSEALATIKPGSILPDPVLDTFQLVKSVVPAGVQLNWHSSTPIDPGLYTLRVTVNVNATIDRFIRKRTSGYKPSAPGATPRLASH